MVEFCFHLARQELTRRNKLVKRRKKKAQAPGVEAKWPLPSSIFLLTFLSPFSSHAPALTLLSIFAAFAEQADYLLSVLFSVQMQIDEFFSVVYPAFFFCREPAFLFDFSKLYRGHSVTIWSESCCSSSTDTLSS